MDGSRVPVSVPLIIGHRGSSALAPENTLAAFALALEEGADGVEFDVRLARDGVPVVIHDATLERTALRKGRPESFDSASLQELDAGTWFNRRFPERARDGYAGERLPTLAQVFGRFGRSFRVLYVELKGEDEATLARLARAAVEAVRAHSLQDRVVVKCFAHAAIAEVKRLAPELRTAALFERKWTRPIVTKRGIIAQALACGADEVSLHRSLARRPTVEAARRHGLAAIVWTADAPAWLARARALGLRAVITNVPGLLRSELEKLQSRLPDRPGVGKSGGRTPR